VETRNALLWKFKKWAKRTELQRRHVVLKKTFLFNNYKPFRYPFERGLKSCLKFVSRTAPASLSGSGQSRHDGLSQKPVQLKVDRNRFCYSGLRKMFRIKFEIACCTFSAIKNVTAAAWIPSQRSLRLRNDLYCVGWGVKLYSLTPCVDCTTELLYSPSVYRSS